MRFTTEPLGRARVEPAATAAHLQRQRERDDLGAGHALVGGDGLDLRHRQLARTLGSSTRFSRSMMKFAAITQTANTSSSAWVSG